MGLQIGLRNRYLGTWALGVKSGLYENGGVRYMGTGSIDVSDIGNVTTFDK